MFTHMHGNSSGSAEWNTIGARAVNPKGAKIVEAVDCVAFAGRLPNGSHDG